MKTALFAAAALLGLAAAPSAFASTASTLVYTQVPLVCTISATAASTLVTLPTNARSTPMGDIQATCNSAGGYTAAVSTTNGFKMKDVNLASNPTYVVYKLGVGSEQLVADGPVSLGTAAALVDGVTVPIALQQPNRVGANYAGNYQDLVTFTLTAQ